MRFDYVTMTEAMGVGLRGALLALPDRRPVPALREQAQAARTAPDRRQVLRVAARGEPRPRPSRRRISIAAPDRAGATGRSGLRFNDAGPILVSL
jgi:hypothetical protein